jgi:capsular exopolysaccharide synthesis family protein
MHHLTPTPAINAPQFPRLAYESGVANPAIEAVNLITLRDLLRVLRIYWRTILAAAFVVTAIAMLAVSMITPTYLGTALVMVDEQQSHIFNEQTDPSVLSDLPSDPSSIESQVQMLQSHALAGQVVDKLKLMDDPEFNDTESLVTIGNFVPRLMQAVGLGDLLPKSARANRRASQKIREATIGNLLSHLDVHAVGLSTIIAVNLRSASADKAARIANAISDTYIQNLASAKSSASRGASKWLADHVGQLARQASAADAAVQQYKAEHGLIDTSNGTALTDQQLGDLTSQLIQAQGNQAQAQARFTRMNKLVESGRSADVTDAVDSPLIAQLRAQEATLLQQRADLASRYGPRYPAMQDVEARIKVLQGKIDKEVNRIVGTVRNDLAVADAHVGAIKANMAAVTSRTAAQNQARVKLGELQANATSAHALYQTYLDRLKQTEQRASLETPDVHLVSPASVPLSPASPKKLLIVGGAGLASLVLAFLGALIMDRMCNGFRSAGEMSAALGLTVLTTIPELKTRRRALRDVSMQVVRRPNSEFSEALRGLEIGLSQHEDASDDVTVGKAILVTSALPAEGKTSTTVNLARRLAASGHRVIIVDADQKRPRVASALGLHNIRYGLADCLARRCSLDEALIPDPCSSLLALLATGGEDSESVGSAAMASLIERLRQTADYVIIDSPPVLAVHDSKLLGRMVDGTIFVVRWRKTSREAAMLAVNLLREFHVRLIGSALLRADAKQYQYYAFGYTGIPALVGYYKG